MLLKVYGNNQGYNLHLRTGDVWLPWQSCRADLCIVELTLYKDSY